MPAVETRAQAHLQHFEFLNLYRMATYSFSDKPWHYIAVPAPRERSTDRKRLLNRGHSGEPRRQLP
jgi:hypothetical protein